MGKNFSWRRPLSAVAVAAGVAGLVVAAGAPAQARTAGPMHRLQGAGQQAVQGPMTAADAPDCVDASNAPATCPTIVSVTVGNTWIRGSKTTDITYPVTVVVDDPSDIALEVETYMGRGMEQPDPNIVVGYGWTDAFDTTPASGSTPLRKTFQLQVASPYQPIYPQDATPAYGGFQINPVVWGYQPVNPDPQVPNGQFLAETYRSGTILARSAITNTPSSTSVRKGQYFTERGKLTRFDGSPQAGQKVNIYYVPAGQTRASFAGAVTTRWDGTFSLPVRSWYTGSWFVNFPGSPFSTGAYKGVWVRVN